MQERFVSPLNDIVFKTLWLRGDEDLKLYLNRIIEYATKKDISKYHISANETGIVNLDNIANKVDILLESENGKIDIELNNTKDKQGYTPIETVFNKSLIYLSFILYNNLL